MEADAEALYEIRRHATGSLPVHHEGVEASAGGGGAGGGFLSYLSLQGVSKLKERWSGYSTGRPASRSTRHAASLFVSPSGEYVAVAVSNRIVILRKDDGYAEPRGVYTNNDIMTVFTNGAWLEPQGILGVVDDLSTLYFIKENGEEITRRTSKQLKLSSPIIDLVVQDDSKKSLSGFYIFTSDCAVHQFDFTQEPGASLYQVPISSKDVALTSSGQLPRSLSCLDYHQDRSLVVLVGDSNVSLSSSGYSGVYSLYVLHMTAHLELNLMFQSPEFEGLFAPPKGHHTLLSSPKVTISPQGKHVATLDLAGCVSIFIFDNELHSLSLHSLELHGQVSDNLARGNGKHLIDIADISWWTDHILVVVKRDGTVSMYSVSKGNIVSINDPILSAPILERTKCDQRCAFILQSSKYGKNIPTDEHVENYSGHKQLDNPAGNHDRPDIGRIFWSLISFSKITIPEMYSVLIRENRYQEALDFAGRYHLDTDEVYKALWLHSEGGICEIESYLSNIKDQAFVLSQCVNKVGPSEPVLKALISLGLHITDQCKFLDSNDSNESSAWDNRIIRLQLLQYRDMLETFVGINMGRFTAEEYSKFRSIPLAETAIALAESGKIGALNLLIKRHPYTISHDILRILSSIPETVAVQTYSQLLPGMPPPSSVILRDGDWVECEKMVLYINQFAGQLERSHLIKTELFLQYSTGFVWPSVAELCDWYKNRARDIDNLSGQLENCLTLVELACQKGVVELQPFFDDIKYLHQLIYSDELHEFTMSLVTWEDLPDYDKFKIMLKGVKEETVLRQLQETAIPFMRKRLHLNSLTSKDKQEESYLIRWLKEICAENQLAICLAVIENVCGDSPIDGLFEDLMEMIETVVQCIYVCSATDQWNMMTSILSELLHKMRRQKSLLASKDFRLNDTAQDFGTTTISDDSQFGSIKSFDMLEKRIKVVEGHVEVGRLFAYYQVPKPIGFFLSAQSDVKNVKQLIRLLLSKFGRRQPARSDNEWANMWRDLKLFQEKAFPFLDSEYMLTEFIRGLLKAGKFSLARNYLGGTSTVTLATEKAEILVIQAAREYFFSASTLSCNEIWKARECLNLFPNSKNVLAEIDIIDALIIRLPALGVTILPVQFRQIKNPMEIIHMVIAAQTGAYLHVEEIIDIAKLLGLRSELDIAAVEEAIAREAAVNGDLQLAFDLCLDLAKKNHGVVWDLCAAIARGPQLDNMETISRRQLLGFSLSHCDEESIGELLNAWKEIDVRDNFEQLMISTGTNPPNYSIQGSSVIQLPVPSIQDILDLRDGSHSTSTGHCRSQDNDQDHVNIVKEILSKVCMDSSNEEDDSWESLSRENRKILSFSALELPWLLELCEDEEHACKKDFPRADISFRRYRISIKMQAINSILCWLAGNGFAPNDDLVMSLAKSVMEPPVSEEEDVLGCSILLNLTDPFNGVKIIEEELKKRHAYQEICGIMNVGMAYSSVNNAQKECSTPDQRRNLLLQKFHQKFASIDSDELDQINMAQSTFWREWKAKLEEEKRLADQARALKQIMPEIETSRFLSGDANYIKNVVFSFIESVKVEKKHILKEAIKIADTYGLQRTEVLLKFFGCALLSDHWENSDILSEISEFRDDIVKSAKGVIHMISSVVYPQIDGHNKQRLSYIYSILSACHLRLRRTEGADLMKYPEEGHTYILEPFQYYKVLEQECQKVSSIDSLDFKNVAGLDDLNFEHFNEEICTNIRESTVNALGDMVQALVSMYDDSLAKGLISCEGVYKHHVLGLLASLEGRNEARSTSIDADELQAAIVEVELNYDSCRKYIQALPEADISYIVGRYCTLCFPCNFARGQPHEPAWKSPLVMLMTFWIKLVLDIHEKVRDEQLHRKTLCLDLHRLLCCLKAFKQLLLNDEISVNQGWNTISTYIRIGLVNGITKDVLCFCRAMISSGCAFESIIEVYYGEKEYSESVNIDSTEPSDLLELYSIMTDDCLSELIKGSGEPQMLLHKLLSSLCHLTARYADDLKIIRSQIWGKLSSFSENMQQESQLRVYALQLMQCITGRNLKTLPTELVSQVEPWESWYEPGTGPAIPADSNDVPGNITSTLVALRSTQMVASVLPDANITPEHLMSLDSAVSCFLHLSQSASTGESLHVLQSVLEEWEQLFSSKEEQEHIHESPKESNDWSDGWDDGWETLPEELDISAKKQDDALSLHPLHCCWMEIIQKLVGLGELQNVMQLLDQSSSKHLVLLEEDEAQGLLELVSGSDCFMALKVALLLPYDVLRSQCLQMVEAKMRGGAVSSASNADDYELLALVLSSGVLQNIATEEAYAKLFSYVCYLVGHLARVFQHDLLNHWKKGDGSKLERSGSLLFGRLLFPCLISELAVKGHYLLAGSVISRWMHTHTSLGLVDVVEASLRRYLEGQVLQAQQLGDDEIGLAEGQPCHSISYTLSNLQSKLVPLLQSALLALPGREQ